MKKDKKYFDEVKTGALTSRLSSDITRINTALGTTVSTFITNFVQITIALYWMFETNAVVTMYILLLVPLMLILFGIYGVIRSRHEVKTQDAIANASAWAEECISGCKIVKAFGVEEKVSTYYNKKVNKIYSLEVFTANADSFIYSIVFFIMYGAVAMVLYVGGLRVIDNKMNPADIFTLIMYSFTLSFSALGLTSIINDLFIAVGASKRIFEIIAYKSEIPFSSKVPKGIQIDDFMGNITMNNVDFT